jgi:DNA primase
MKFKIVKKSQNYLIALCPYHKETVPSLMIHRNGERAGQWICRGCGAYGRLNKTEMQQFGCRITKIKRKSSDQWEKLQQFYHTNYKYNIAGFPSDFYNWWDVQKETYIKAGIGLDYINQCLTFPMRNATGQIVGIQRRFWDGTKKFIFGSEFGLFYDWPVKPKSQLIVCEGITDGLTISDWNYWTVSIASATMISQKIIDFIFAFQPKCVILLADNDNAGISLMHKIRSEYLKKFNKSAALIIPSSPYKDIRELKQGIGSELALKWLEKSIKKE